jgi:hypothetical protein
MAKITRITLSKNQFEERNGKLYHKVLKREVFEEAMPTGNDPEWYPRCEQLKAAGYEDADIAAILNKEGYTSKHGKRINTDTIRCRRSNRIKPSWKRKKVI